MRFIYLSFLLSFLFSCKEKKNAQLEINFTSSNKTVYTELRSFTLTKVSTTFSNYRPEQVTFKNIHCVSPNKFFFESLDTGNYIGLLQFEYNGTIANVDIYPLHLNMGRNVLAKEVNLGEVSLPK